MDKNALLKGNDTLGNTEDIDEEDNVFCRCFTFISSAVIQLKEFARAFTACSRVVPVEQQKKYKLD